MPASSTRPDLTEDQLYKKIDALLHYCYKVIHKMDFSLTLNRTG